MNNRQILRYVLSGIYNRIKRLEKKLEYKWCNISNRGYIYIRLTKTKKELKKEYNQLVYYIKEKIFI